MDNHSEDDSREVVKDQAGWLRLERNLGFAAAVNRGLSDVDTEFVALVNSDVVLERDWLAELEDTLTGSAAAFACPLLLAAHNQQLVDGAWDLLSRSGCPLRALHLQSLAHPDAAQARPIQFPPMTASLFHMDVFRQAGFLDEEFVNYLEDVEFGLRAALAGFEGVFQPRARAVHVGSATLGAWSAKSTYWNARNQLLLLARHYSPSRLRRWWRPILAGQLLFLALAARRGHLLAALKGKTEILRDWRAYRSSPSEGSPAPHRHLDHRLAALIESSEAEIEAQVGARRTSLFWWAYFALAGSPKREPHGS